MLHLKHKLLALAVVASSYLALTSPVLVNALPCPDGFDGGTAQQIERGSCAGHQTGGPELDAQETGDPSRGSNFEAKCETDDGEALNKENCGIVAYIVTFTNVLSGLVGVVVVIMIAVGGIQYTTARDDPQAVAAARNRIRDAVLALVFYLVGVAFLQWLVPGGIF